MLNTIENAYRLSLLRVSRDVFVVKLQFPFGPTHVWPIAAGGQSAWVMRKHPVDNRVRNSSKHHGHLAVDIVVDGELDADDSLLLLVVEHP